MLAPFLWTQCTTRLRSHRVGMSRTHSSWSSERKIWDPCAAVNWCLTILQMRKNKHGKHSACWAQQPAQSIRFALFEHSLQIFDLDFLCLSFCSEIHGIGSRKSIRWSTPWVHLIYHGPINIAWLISAWLLLYQSTSSRATSCLGLKPSRDRKFNSTLCDVLISLIAQSSCFVSGSICWHANSSYCSLVHWS